MLTVVSLLSSGPFARGQEVLDPGGSRETLRPRGISRILKQARNNQPLEKDE